MRQLFKHQIEGAEWLKKRKKAILADQMGLGKTIQAIGLIIILWLIFQIIILINNRIKRKKLYAIEERLDKIESKINKLLRTK